MAPQTQRIDTDPKEATWRELDRQLAEPAAFDRLLQQEEEMERHPAATHGTGLRSCVGKVPGPANHVFCATHGHNCKTKESPQP